MKRGNALIATLMVAMMAAAFPLSVWAGGELTDEDKDDGDTTTGPYGFVKDTRENPIPEATVTVDIKNRGQLVTQTNVLGAYRIPTFGIEIKPDEVTISCKKEGYRQREVIQRLGLGDPGAGFEVDCILQKQ